MKQQIRKPVQLNKADHARLLRLARIIGLRPGATMRAIIDFIARNEPAFVAECSNGK